MRPLYLILLLCLFCLKSFGQVPPTATPKQLPPDEEVSEGDIVRVNTTLVGVPVTVLDRDGRFVPGLKQEDFHIYEDGVEQQIAYFAPIEAPVTVLLLFDHFVKNYEEEARAFARQLRTGDKVIVARFGDAKYEILTTSSDGQAGVQQEPHRIKWHFGTSIHDAVHDAVRRMNSIQGRKAIVLSSDGRVGGVVTVTKAMPSDRVISEKETKATERATVRSTIKEAEESDAPIYVIQYDTRPDEVRYGLKPGTKYNETYLILLPSLREEYREADEYLHALAEKSGGRLYQVSASPLIYRIFNPPDLTQPFMQINAELRQQYSLGYYPKQTGKAKTPHEIKVLVAKPDVVVRSRTSYFSKP